MTVSAAALNFIDVMKAMGTYPDPTGASLLGGECAGVVTAVGEAVPDLRIGDRVVACGFGALASHLVVDAAHVRRIPSWMDDTTAAAMPLVTITAWYGLVELAALGPGDTVLIHSAAGGLGLAAIGVARHVGARIIATAGIERKRDYLRAQGIEHVFDSRDLSWRTQVLEVTDGKGVDVVLNSLTGAAITMGLEVLAEDGRFIEVGKRDIYADRLVGLAAFRKGISFAAVDLAGVMQRRPERFRRQFTEVWDRITAGDLPALPVRQVPFSDAVDALRDLARGTHIGKVVLTDPETVAAVTPDPMPDGTFRADGTYLITGGLGALGLSLAEFFADHGAGALALLGRSAPSADARQRLSRLRERGVRVHTYQVDVTDRSALAEVVADIRQRLPGLRAVVHAAGVLADATVANLTFEQLEPVIAPKVDGARHLDELTRNDPLDLFVLFSSAAALVGNAGQAAYAAANAYLDGLAQARRRRGVPGLSIQWGPFAEIGLAAADSGRGDRLEERGMGSFTTDDAWDAFVTLTQTDVSVVGYVPLDRRRWFDAYPDTAALASWQLLRDSSSCQSGDGAGSAAFRAALRDATPHQRPHLVEEKVKELTARVLRMDSASLERDAPFKSLGLDSLLSLELRNRLEAAFDLRLSPTLLWTYGTVAALTKALCERVAPPEA